MRQEDEIRSDDARTSRSTTPTEDERILTASESMLTDESTRSNARRRRTLLTSAFITLALFATIIGALIWRSRKASEPAAEEASSTVVSVRVAKAERQLIAAQVAALGTISPREQATVSAKIGAQIKSMPLLKNKVVRAGDTIATLEARDLQAQRAEALAALNEARINAQSVVTGTIPQTNAQDQRALSAARATVTNARAVYERRRALYQQGGISQRDLESSQLALTTAEDDLRLAEQTAALRARSLNPNDRAAAAARVNAAQQRLNTLDAQLSYATIRAPISGVVTDQYQFEGEFAAAGARLVTIADMSEVIVKAPFADTIAAQLKAGDAATVLPTDIAGERMGGRISLISRVSDPTNRTVEVWVTLGNEAGRLRTGGAAQVIVSTDTKPNAIVIPAAAVTLDATNANDGTVMTVDANNVAHETKVTVGIRTNDKVEITSGLQGNETVVVEGNYALPDNTKVEVAAERDDKKDDAAGDDRKNADAKQGSAESDAKKGGAGGDAKKGDEP